MNPLDVVARQALSQADSPYGAVGLLHAGSDLNVWWIWKDGEEIEPTLSVMDRDDLLYVVQGALRLDLEGRQSFVLRAGELFVIPAGTPFRGYRWPVEGEPCLFLAVAPASATFTRLSSPPEAIAHPTPPPPNSSRAFGIASQESSVAI